jgi:uncharacterized protein YciI
MRKMKVLFVALALCAAFAAAQAPAGPNVPRNLKPYFAGLYVRGVNYSQAESAERAELFAKHLAYLRSQIEAGNYVVAGPFLDDGPVRGIAIIKADSAEAARRIADADPMVQSGWLSMVIHPTRLPDLSPVRVEYPAKETTP